MQADSRSVKPGFVYFQTALLQCDQTHNIVGISNIPGPCHGAWAMSEQMVGVSESDDMCWFELQTHIVLTQLTVTDSVKHKTVF